MAPSKGLITLKLTPWQIRMVNDFLHVRGKKFEKVVINFHDKIHYVTYRMPDPDIIGGWNLYLSDQQIKRIQEKFNLQKLEISAINISDAMIKNNEVVFA
jgi:hypothetical protein